MHGEGAADSAPWGKTRERTTYALHAHLEATIVPGRPRAQSAPAGAVAVPMGRLARAIPGFVAHGEARAAAQILRPEGTPALKERCRGAGLRSMRGCPRF